MSRAEILRRGLVRMWMDSFTLADGETFDVGRIIGFWSLAGFNFLQTWSVVVQNQPFNPQDFGIGLGAAMAGVGALLKLKESTEPASGGKP